MNTLLDKNKAHSFLYMFALMMIIGVSVFLITLKHITNYGDVALHIRFGNEMWEGTRRIAYPGWYVVHKVLSLCCFSDRIAAALTNVFFSMLCSIMVFGLSDFLGKVSLNKKCAIVLFMHFFGPLYFSQFGERYYLGQGTFNTWHSPTNTCVKFAALFVFVAFTKYFHMKETDQWILNEKIQLTKKQLWKILFFVTFISLLLKPSFFQVFAPMLAVVFIMDFICERRSLKEYITDAAIFVPSACLIVYQLFESLLSTTAAGLGGEGIEIAFLAVWKLYSDHIGLSILSVILFPVFVGVFCEKKLTDNKLLLYAYIFHTIAILEFAVLAECGARRDDANFMWGMNLSIGILFFSAVLTFERYLRENIARQSIAYKTKKYVGYVLLFAHFAGGAWYYLRLLLATSRQCF